jgi:hypothetical protein
MAFSAQIWSDGIGTGPALFVADVEATFLEPVALMVAASAIVGEGVEEGADHDASLLHLRKRSLLALHPRCIGDESRRSDLFTGKQSLGLKHLA